MAAALSQDDAASRGDWLFESIVSSLKDNDRNLLWVCSAFLIASFVAVSFNLGALSEVEFAALSVKGSLTSTSPIRIMLCVACAVSFVAIFYLVLEHQRLQLGLEYLAALQHEEAGDLGSFNIWLRERHPTIARAKSLTIIAFVSFCASILALDVATLIYSFSA
jgi:hypothetical protein